MRVTVRVQILEGVMLLDYVWIALGALIAAPAFYKLYNRDVTGPAKVACWALGVFGVCLAIWAGHNILRVVLTADV